MENFSLENTSKIKTGFVVPNNYFDDFENEIMQKINKEEPKTKSLLIQKKTMFYSVAAILIISFSFIMFNDFSQNQALDNQNIEDYMLNHAGLSDMELADLLTESDFQKIKLDLKIEDKTIETELLENSNLENYLNY